MLQHSNKKGIEGQSFLLTRNIHRLEKALIMKPRKPHFGLDYIGETVLCYKRCLELPSSECLSEQLTWAADVLNEYFAAVSPHPLVEAAHNLFKTIPPKEKSAKIPYYRQLTELPVSFDAFKKLCERRRSVRWFLNRPVDRKLIDQAVSLATQAPSSCNRQPFFYRFYDDPALVKEVSVLPHGTIGFAHNIPVICAVVGDLSAYLREQDRHTIYIDASLANMNFMLALETLGLSSCPLNWPDVELFESRMEKVLKIPKHQRIIMMIAIGYPDPEGLVAYSQKKTLEQIRSFNTIGPNISL